MGIVVADSFSAQSTGQCRTVWQGHNIRSANARSRKGPNEHGYDEDEISDILQDDGRCDMRTMGQRVRELERPRMMTGQIMISSEV